MKKKPTKKVKPAKPVRPAKPAKSGAKKTSARRPVGKTEPTGRVVIPDSGFRKGLRNAGCTVKDGSIAEEALARLTDFDWSDEWAEAFPGRWESMGDLRGLEHAVALRKLSIGENHVRSLEPVRPLVELEEIWAAGNQIESVAPLANKPKLKLLYLRGNPLKSIAELRGLPALEDLDLPQTKVADLSPLLELPKLRKLDIWEVEGARKTKNLDVLAALAGRQVVLRMDPKTQQALDQHQAAALMEEPSTDPVLERLRQLAQPALALLWKKGGAAARDDEWNTVLHRVMMLDDKDLSKHGNPDALRIELVKALAGAGVDVDAQNDDHGHHTALSQAVNEGRSAEVIQALLAAGASVRLPRRRPVLAIALEKARPSEATIEQLLAAGADVSHLAVLAEAAKNEKRRAMIEPALRSVDWRKQAHLKTPALTEAVKAGNDAMIDLLLDAGAPPNSGATYPPVFYAKTVATLDKLVARGADPLVRTAYGSALHHLRNAALVDRLVDLGVPIDGRDFHCYTALGDLAHHGEMSLETGQKLIARGADPNAWSWTPGDRWPEGFTLLDTTLPGGRDMVRKLGGVTTKVWVSQQVKIITGAKVLEGEAWEALVQLALAGHLEKLGAAKTRIAKQVKQMLAARTDQVSKTFASLGLHPIPILWLARGIEGRDLFERGFLQIAAHYSSPWNGAKLHALLRALCEQGAPVDFTDGWCNGALEQYVEKAMRKFPPDLDVVRAMMPKRTALITAALIALLRYPEPLTAEWNAFVDLVVDAGADLTVPEVFALICGRHRKDLVRRALDAGADPTWEDEDMDFTALSKALEFDDLDVIEMLLNAGAPPDLGWETRGPAFHQARSVAALDLLRQHKLDASLRRGYGKETLLDAAVERLVARYPRPDDLNQAVQFIKHLLTSGFDLDAVDSEGKTPRSRLQSADDEDIRAAIAAGGLA